MTGLVVAARLAQFVGAAVLFGAPSFFVYSRGGLASRAAESSRQRPLLWLAALLTLLGSVAALLAQTAAMAGDPAAAGDPTTVWSVLSGTQFGMAIAARIAGALAVLLAVAAIPVSRGLWVLIAALGGLVLMSFAWTGHGAADDGPGGLAHLSADLLHLLAAGVWLGALAALLMQALATRPEESASVGSLYQALAGFSGVGSAVVAILVLTGLVNSWFLIGPNHLKLILSSTYGLVLVAKLAAFAAMLGLAALNRFRLTPRLAGSRAEGGSHPSLAALRTSLLVETATGLVVLILVSVLGAIAPLSAL